MEQELKLHEAEYRFACIIWEHEPLSSGELAQLCRQQLNLAAYNDVYRVEKALHKRVL